MEKYHKIQTVFKRNPRTKFRTLLDEHSTPEFEYLKNIEWVWTEKIDGTNIRIMWDGENVRFGGKTNNAQIPTFLLNVLQDTFTPELMGKCFDDATCLYGEGFGAKIQKGGNYIPDGVNFILFDCLVGIWWLKREQLMDVAEKLHIKIVPIIGSGTLDEAVEHTKKGFKSRVAFNKDYIAEGLVLKPREELFTRRGDRIISKIKHKDF